jgi:hypothetical protein
MKKRANATGKPAKARRRKGLKPKARSAPKAMPRRGSVPAGQDAEVARLTRELNEALEQQTATSEVLQVISSSPGDLERVFAAMLENAARVCDAKFGGVHRWDGHSLQLMAIHKNTPPALAEYRRRSPPSTHPNSPVGRMLATKTTVHVADIAAELGHTDSVVTSVEIGGVEHS